MVFQRLVVWCRKTNKESLFYFGFEGGVDQNKTAMNLQFNHDLHCFEGVSSQNSGIEFAEIEA